MAWKKGWNFRTTDTFVTDGADETYVLAADSYPITRNGVTFGWETFTNIQARDRDAALDRRLAGIHREGSGAGGASGEFRADLESSGAHRLRAAFGDGTPQAMPTLTVSFKDTSTVFASINDTDGTASGHWDDATGADHLTADWPTNNVAVSRTFTTTIFRMLIGPDGAASNENEVAHLMLEQLVVDTGRLLNRTYRPRPFAPGSAR